MNEQGWRRASKAQLWAVLIERLGSGVVCSSCQGMDGMDVVASRRSFRLRYCPEDPEDIHKV